MVNQFYLERDHQKFGPYSAEHIKKLGAANRIQSTDIVWREGGVKGVFAAQVTGLHSVLQAGASDDSAPAAENLSSRIAVLADGSLSQSADLGEGAPADRVTSTVPDGLRLIAIPGEVDIDSDVSPAPTAVGRGAKITGAMRAVATDEDAKAPAPPDKPARSPDQPTPHKDRVRKLRAVAKKGAIILSQDGEFATYKKKCFKCGLEDSAAARMPLRSGPNRTNFFCPKCRKMRDVEIQGAM